MRDSDAVIPFKRDKKYEEHKPPTVKMKYTDPNDPDEKIEFYIKTYSATENEDAEAFLDMFMDFRENMETKNMWDDNATQTTDASRLFLHFKIVLRGTAKNDWLDVLNENQPHGETWKDWKTLVPKFILKKVLPQNAYAKQKRYIEERSMPAEMDVQTYSK